MNDEALPPVRYTATVLQFEICLPPTSLPIHTRPCLTVDNSAVSSSKYKKKDRLSVFFLVPGAEGVGFADNGTDIKDCGGYKKKTACRSSFWCPQPNYSRTLFLKTWKRYGRCGSTFPTRRRPFFHLILNSWCILLTHYYHLSSGQCANFDQVDTTRQYRCFSILIGTSHLAPR